MDYHRMGKRIYELRKRRGYTQEALAEAADLSASYLSHIERATKKASLGALVRLAAVLETSVDWLLNGTETSGQNAFLPETQELLEDCAAQERRILFETAKAVKQILRDNKWAA